MKYAEDVLSRNFSLQSNTAAFLGSGALTVLSVGLAAYSLIVTFDAQRGALPTSYLLFTSAVLVVISAAAFLLAWLLCDLEPETDVPKVMRDLIAREESVDTVRGHVLHSMLRAYQRNRNRLLASLLLVTGGIPLAITAVGLVLYRGVA